MGLSTFRGDSVWGWILDQRGLYLSAASARLANGRFPTLSAPKPPFRFRPICGRSALRPLIRLRRPPKRTFPFGRKPRAKERPALIADEARLVRNNRSVS